MITASTMTNLAATPNAIFRLTRVQLEKGTVATPFETLPYGLELMLCQRYYQRVLSVDSNTFFFGGGLCWNATGAIFSVTFLAPMRTVPTMNYNGSFMVISGGVQIALTSMSIVTDGRTTTSARVDLAVASGLTTGQVALLRANGATAASPSWIEFNAEF